MRALTSEEKKRLKKLLILLSALFALGIAYYVFIKLTGVGIPCIFYSLTHKYCPGCGVTRMFVALFSGDIAAAFGYNALILILLPFIAGYIVYLSVLYVKRGTVYSNSTVETVILSVTGALLLAFGILRNIL